MILPTFLGPTYQSQSLNVDAERCLNWYPEVTEMPGAKAKLVLYPTPGVTSAFTLADFPVRGMFDAVSTLDGAEVLWIVSGSTLYYYTTGAPVAVTPVQTSSLPAYFATNGYAGLQLAILSGGKVYIYNTTTGIVSGPTDLTASHLDFLDGYFLIVSPSTGVLAASALEDGTSWPGNMTATRDTAADPWVAMKVIHREIWLLGNKTGEVWYNAGLSPFPMAPIEGAFFEYGIAAPHSLANVNQAPVWLARNAQGFAMVVRGRPYTPERISTHAVETAIQGYPAATIAAATAYSYQEQGHTFYVLDFQGTATWAWDETTNLWHERGWWNSATMTYESNRYATSAFAFGQHYVGDRTTGDVYTASVTTATDVAGTALRRMRRASHISQENQWLFHQSLQVDLEAGIGAASGQGSDPQAMLRWSDDGGHAYGQEHWVSAGAQGAYRARALWRRLGRSRDRIYEVVVSDPVPWRLINGYLLAEQGTS